MATVRIREYADIASTYGKQAQAVAEPGLVDQAVSTSGASAQSAAFGDNTTLLAISVPGDNAVAYLVGANPTALTTTSLRLPANSLVYVGVRKGQKIAFIDVT